MPTVTVDNGQGIDSAHAMGRVPQRAKSFGFRTAGGHQSGACPLAKGTLATWSLDFRRFSSPILVFKELLKTALGDL